MEDKLFLGFGILTVICGVLLLLDQNYVVGISGSVVGLMLIFQNIKKLKDKNNA